MTRCSHGVHFSKCIVCIKNECDGVIVYCGKCSVRLCCVEQPLNISCFICYGAVCEECSIKDGGPIYCSNIKCTTRCVMCKTLVPYGKISKCFHKHSKPICYDCCIYDCVNCARKTCDCVCCKKCKRGMCQFYEYCKERCDSCEELYCYECDKGHVCIPKAVQSFTTILPAAIVQDLARLVFVLEHGM